MNFPAQNPRPAYRLALAWTVLLAVAMVHGYISYELFGTRPVGPNFSGEVAERVPLANPRVFRLAVLGDCRGNTEALEAILEHARGRADAAVILGDIVDYASGIQYRFVNREITEATGGMPVFTGIGNHDLDRKGRGDFFRGYFGPDHWWWRFGHNLFLMLNNVEESRWVAELEWLSQTLRQEVQPADHIWLMMHKPPALDTDLLQHTLSGEKSAELFNLFREFPKLSILASHIHVLKEYDFHGFPVIISGAAGAPQHLDPPSYGYFLLECTPENCRSNQINLGPIPQGDLVIEKSLLLFYYYPGTVGIALAAVGLGIYHRRRNQHRAKTVD